MTIYKRGDYVKHITHGVGKILNVSTKTDQCTVEFKTCTWVCQIKDIKRW